MLCSRITRSRDTCCYCYRAEVITQYSEAAYSDSSAFSSEASVTGKEYRRAVAGADRDTSAAHSLRSMTGCRSGDELSEEGSLSRIELSGALSYGDEGSVSIISYCSNDVAGGTGHSLERCW